MAAWFVCFDPVVSAMGVPSARRPGSSRPVSPPSKPREMDLRVQITEGYVIHPLVVIPDPLVDIPDPLVVIPDRLRMESPYMTLWITMTMDL